MFDGLKPHTNLLSHNSLCAWEGNLKCEFSNRRQEFSTLFFQMPTGPRVLEIHDKMHFDEFHKKEKLTKWKLSRGLFSKGRQSKKTEKRKKECLLRCRR
jgi:hypothetical protein